MNRCDTLERYQLRLSACAIVVVWQVSTEELGARPMSLPKGRWYGGIVDSVAGALPPATRMRREVVSALIVIAAGLCAYARGVTNEFLGDDWMLIHQAEPFLEAPRFFTLFSSEYYAASLENMYRPLSTVSYVVDYQIAGLSPLVYHVQSLMWHLVASLLVTRLAARIVGSASRVPSTVAGVFFAIHPVLTEAVDAINFREDVMVTALVVGSLLLALRNRRGALLAAVIVFALALLSKETALVTPLLLVAIRSVMASCAAPSRRWFTLECAVFAAMSIAYLIVRFGPLSPPPGQGPDYPAGALLPTLARMPEVLAHYLRLVVAPWPLCADYLGVISFDPAPVGPWLVASYVLVVGYVVVGIWLVRRAPVIALGMTWFVIALLPVCNVLRQTIPVAERFLYLPLAGMALVIAAGAAHVAQLPRRRAICAAALAAIVASVFVLLCNLRHRVWKNDLVLAATTISDFPANWHFRIILGNSLFLRGHYELAIREAEGAMTRLPRIRSAWIENKVAQGEGDMAMASLELGDLDKAEKLLRASLSRSYVQDNQIFLGIVLGKQKKYAAARSIFEDVAASDERDHKALYQLALLHREQGDEATARQLLEQARSRRPHDSLIRRALENGTPSTP